MIRSSRLAFALVLAASLASAPRAGADSEARPNHAERGARAFNLQKFDQALFEFQAAYAEHPDPAFLFNIGQCQRQLGQYDAAARSYRAYLGQQPEAGNRDEVMRRIENMEEAARQQRAAMPPQGVIEPSRPDVKPAAPPPARPRTLRNAGIGVAAAGGAGVVLGAVFAGLAKSAGDSAYHGMAYDYSADNRYHAYQTAEIVTFTVGGAALATGVVLLVIDSRARK